MSTDRLPDRTPPRVLHLVRPAEGGIRRHVSLLCAGLERRGVVCEVAAAPGFTLEGEAAAPVRPVPITSSPHPSADVRAALRVRRLAPDYDVVHAHGLRAAWIAALGCGRRPFLFTAHNLASPTPSFAVRVLFGLAARRARGVIAVSHAVAESLAPLGVRPDRTRVIPNGIDLDRWLRLPPRDQARSTLGIGEQCELVLAVGRLSPEKGFDTLARAAAAIRQARPGARIWIAGEGPTRKAIEDAAGSAGTVRMLGRREDIPLLMAAADVIVVPSLREGQGLVAVEAMAAGRPVVASHVGGLAETVLDGVTGVLLPPADFLALASAVTDLLADGDVRRAMGAAGRDRAARLYSAETMVERTLEAYRAIIG